MTATGICSQRHGDEPEPPTDHRARSRRLADGDASIASPPRSASRRESGWTWAPPPKHGPPIARPEPRQRRPAAECSWASVGISPPAARLRGTAGRSELPTTTAATVTAPGQTVSIRSGGLATSSTAVRRWSHNGHTMHHVIDPRTGAPARTMWRTVSVAAADCTEANIATTAALVRADAAPAWLADQGLPARLVAWRWARHDRRRLAVGAR